MHHPPIKQAASTGADVRELLRMLRRRKLMLLAPVMLGLAAAWLVHGQLTPSYQAEASIVLNLRTTKVLEVNDVVSGLPREQATVRTEMDVLSSRSMAERVVDRLHLVDRPEFLDRHLARQPSGAAFDDARARLGEWLAGLRGFPQPAPELQDRRELLVDLVQAGVSVNNDGQSFTLRIRFVSPDADFAAEIANAYADEYLAYQVEIKLQATREAGRWLSTRIDGMRPQLEAADRAVDDYRRQIGTIGDQGQSESSLRVAEISREIVEAEARRRDIDTRLKVLREAIATGRIETAPEILGSPVIAAFRQQLAATRGKEAELLGSLGGRHPALLAVRDDRLALEREIAGEAARIALGLGHEAKAAAARIDDLRASFAQARARLDEVMSSEMRLKQLEREAAAERELYENYLVRMKELQEQEQLQTPDAWIITRAQSPWLPTYPRRLAILLLGLFGGGLLGSLLAFLRERLDDSLYSAAEAEQLTGLPVLGLLPHAGRRAERLLRRPHAAFAEALRATGLAVSFAAQARAAQVIAVTSALPREGKTTFCTAMAHQLALEGRRVLLIDADLRRPRAREAMGGDAGSGPDLIELLRGRCAFEDVVRRDARSGAEYLAARAGIASPMPLLESPALAALLARARQDYDLVVVDTPPVGLATDAAVIARNVDACLFFVRWGSTSREAVLQGLRLLALCRVRVTGIVLSQVNLRRQAGYAPQRMLPTPYAPAVMEHPAA